MLKKSLFNSAIITLMITSIFSCSKVDSSIDHQVNEDYKTMQRAHHNGVFYLSPTKGQKILSSEIVEVFLSGWKYENDVTISGYTATDDLWTIISTKSPTSQFDLVKIELTHLKYDSQEWHDCIQDICILSQEIDNIIVLDQDLEIALVCMS